LQGNTLLYMDIKLFPIENYLFPYGNK